MEEVRGTGQITVSCCQPQPNNQDLTDPDPAPQQPPSDAMSSDSKRLSSSTGSVGLTVELSNGSCEVETVVALHCPGDGEDVTAEGDLLALSNDGMSEFSNSDISLPEVCISANSNSFEENMNYEVQQAYKIFTGFLLDKHKGITSSFLHPIGHQEAQHGIGGVRSRAQAHLRQSMCLRRIEEKFMSQEYETITEFVADFRLMLENCYRYHGVDHFISKQAQKLEIMLEQKLTLLSRTLREKTTLAVTSKGRFGAEEERGSGGTSTRRRLATRSLATITVGGHESVMVQNLRLEEQQRAKEEKRQRELEKKEAEEMSAKEVDEWEQSLLSQASPHTVDTLWEVPAIGHFLCLAQTALNLPEIVFFELERCLLMPRCSLLLSKIMSSLLSPPQRRSTLHRRPALPYRRWESELRQRVLSWYQTIGASHDQLARAEQLGLCHQFFSILGDVSPLEEKPFHLLPFYQRVWLLKGLCDHVYETQKDVQDAVLAQPIHECRESILGYDSKENAYIHFPHFCGADLRIYCQSPSTPPAFPFPSALVKRVEIKCGTEGYPVQTQGDKSDGARFGGSENSGETQSFKKENSDEEEHVEGFNLWSLKTEEVSSDENSCDESKVDFRIHTNTWPITPTSSTRRSDVKNNLKEDKTELEHQSKRLRLNQEPDLSLGSIRTINAATQEPRLSVGEHSYTGRFPACAANRVSPSQSVKTDGKSPSLGRQSSSCSECRQSKIGSIEGESQECCCRTSDFATRLSSGSAQNSSDETTSERIWTKKKKRKKKRGREQLPGLKREHEQLQPADGRGRPPQGDDAMSAVQRGSTTTKRKDKRKHKAGKVLEISKKIKDELPVEPFFKLVCTNLEELRELISKTEDELDDLESSKKRLGRWYYRREAVKDLHSTLIRLLNELSPWEPKLMKAHQRNRLRLKKEFEVFKKHPEYNNFVREECFSSSSSDDDEDGSLGKEVCLLTEHLRRSEEEDLENVVPRGLWTGGSTREFVTESAGERTGTHLNHLKHPLAGPEKGVGILSRLETGIANNSAAPNSDLQSRSELIHLDFPSDLNSTWVSRVSAQTSLTPKFPILHPTTGLPKGYTPIPMLLAKSVGNKVTLMKRPADFLGVNNVDGQRKRPVVSSLSTSAVTAIKLSKAQSSSSISQQDFQQMETQGQRQQTQTVQQPGAATVTAALPRPPQTKPSQTLSNSPVQVVYKVPEGLGHLVRKESNSSGPIKISVQPVMDHNTGEKMMQQVVILPSNLLIHKTEEKSLFCQQQPKGVQTPVPKVATPLCMSTNVPGFSIPENRIPVQQVAPLKDARTEMKPSPSISPCLHQKTINTTGLKGALPCSPQTSTPQCVPNHSPITAPASAAFTDPAKSTDPKQELKTVCIRDSQSILVTTRGGNTGIVKVQTSSEQNALGSLPTSPVITISPQFKAFLVTKAAQTACPSASSQTSSRSISPLTSISVAQSPRQVATVLKSPSNVTTPVPTAVSGSVPVTSQVGQSAGAAVTRSLGSKMSASCMVAAKTDQAEHAAVGAGMHLQKTSVQSSAIVPSLNSSGVCQGTSPAEFTSKPGVKQPSTDEVPQMTKFILVTPPSSSSSSPSKGTLSSTATLPTSQVMFISQATMTSSMTFMQSSKAVPKQVVAAGGCGPLLATSLSTEKMGRKPNQSLSSFNSEPLSKLKDITIPSGQKHISTAQIIVTSPNSSSGCPSVAPPHTLSPPGLKHTGMASFSVSPPGSSMSTLTADSCPAVAPVRDPQGPHGTAAVQSGPIQSSLPTLAPQHPNIQSGVPVESSSVLHLSQLPQNKTQTLVSATEKPASITGNTSSAPATSTPFTTAATGTIQQKIVINTSTPLTAGTHIVLNNTHFVIPPQGLSAGSHVLIISSPAPQQVPSISATTIRAAAPMPLHGVSHATVAPRVPVLPLTPTRLPGVPAASSPFVACTPATLLATSSSVTPVCLTGTPSVSSTLVASKTNIVSTMPRFPGVQAAATVVSAPPQLDASPALFPPVMTSASVLGSLPATVMSVAGTPAYPTTISALAPSLRRLSAPTLTSAVLPNPSAVALLSPYPAPAFSVPPSSHSSPLTPQVASPTSVRPQQTALRVASSSQSQALLHMGLGSTSVKKPAPATVQPVLTGARTQVLPTVAVPPIVSTVSRMQTLPIATVPPIGSTANSFDAAAAVCTLPSSSNVVVTPAQPITALKSNTAIHPSAIVSDPVSGKHPLQTSTLGLRTSVASKLLISPDGAVLSTGHCQVRPKPLANLVVSASSSAGAFHDSSLHPSQADAH